MRVGCAAIVGAIAAGCGGDAHITVHLAAEDTEPVPGAPIAGAQVAVLGGGGDVATLIATDVDGEAELELDRDAGPATVIVARTAAVSPALYVIAGVTGGARIELGGRARPAPTSVAGIQTVTYTAFPGGPWAVDNDFYPCTNGGTSTTPGVITIETDTGCEATERTMYLTSYDSTTLAPAAFAPVPGVAAVPGALTAGAWEPGTDYSIAVTGLPVTAIDAYTELTYPGAWRQINVTTTLAGGAGTGTRREATIAGAAGARTQIRITGAMPVTIYQPEVQPPAVALAVDAIGLPPLIANVAFDPATRTLSWDQTTGLPATLIAFTFRFVDPVSSLGFDWAVYAPATAASVVVPELPDELTAYDLRADMPVALRALWLVTVDGATYEDLVADIDLDLPLLGQAVFHPAAASQLSGGDLF